MTGSRRFGGRAAISLQAKLFNKARSAYLGRPLQLTGSAFLHLTPGARLTLLDRSSL